MRTFIKVSLVLALAAGVTGAVIALVRRNGASAASTSQPASHVAAALGAIRLVVTSSGRVVANLDIEIKCKASGQVVSLPVDVSDTVDKDQLLVKLDPKDENRRVRQKEIALRASQAKLEQARLNLRVARENLATERLRAAATLRSAEAKATDAAAKAQRVKALLDKKIATPEEYDTAATAAAQTAADVDLAKVHLQELDTQEAALELKRQDVTLAETAVQLDEVELELARQSRDDTTVVAPMPGVITQRFVQTGQIISSAISNVGGGTTVLVLSDLSRLFVKASVDESDIGKVAVGQPVVVTADAFPDTRFRGVVVRIAPQGTSVSNVVTFEVTIEVEGRNKSLLKPQMTADVEIIAADKAQALLVPAEAIRRSRGQWFVTVVKPDGQTEDRAVEPGINDGVSVEIVNGLAEGEAVSVAKDQAASRWRASQAGPPPPGLFPGGGRRR